MPTNHGWMLLCLTSAWMIQPQAPLPFPLARTPPVHQAIVFAAKPLPGPGLERPVLRPVSSSAMAPPKPGPEPALAPGFRF